MQKHVFGQIGHYIILAVVALSAALDREKVISDQVHGTIQVATASLGAGWVAAIIHNGWIAKAQAAASAAATGAETMSKKLAEAAQLIRDLLSNLPKGGVQ